MPQTILHSTLIRTQRLRKLALTAGWVIGMVAGSFASPMAHAATAQNNASAQAGKATTAPSSSQPPKKVVKAKAKAKPKVVEKIVPAPPPEATPEQLAAAERVLIGRYECEFGKSLTVDANDINRGYFNIKLDKQTWLMKPVLSSTGAIRLEDVKGNTLLLQILTKSMLMDTKLGRRLVDGCIHEVQKAAEEELRRNPQSLNLQ